MKINSLSNSSCKCCFTTLIWTSNNVILNELFTTATSYDAEIMGKQVLQSFMKKNFLGIYVTHLQELAQTWDKGIVSITALVDKDEKTRTYHIDENK